ncbi:MULTISPECIES: hypothetical protein [Holdemanella]
MPSNNSNKGKNSETFGYQPIKPENRGYQPKSPKPSTVPKPPKGTHGKDA